MRLKYQSLIALGISTVILSGCTTTSGGFLNLGVVDALKKSRANIFQQRLTYRSTPIGNTGLSLPTFGNQPAPASGPVIVDSYVEPQSAPLMMQSTPAPDTSDCGCGTVEGAVVSTQQFYMPPQQNVEHQQFGDVVVEQSQSEIVEPPSVNNLLPEAAEPPKANPLPAGNSDPGVEINRNDNFEDLDTVGTLEPLGQKEEKEEDDVFDLESQNEIADGQRGKDQSVFEEADATKPSKVEFDSATNSSQDDYTGELKPNILTLHARPAQSHNMFNRTATTQKPLETVQASHKPYYRQQNALRQQPTKLNDSGYRQAKNTNREIEFKPLPPVVENPSVPVLTPKTKLAPLHKSNINHGNRSDETQKSNTRTADATNNQTVKTAPRVPILRATTVSSASILSLKNLANVVEDNPSQKSFYNANSRTAQGTTSTSIER